ncbi:MAG TPA: Hsp20/alpha crystallin family protein [Phycisphaerae bacterium]|jgi:HSP20 family protein
MTLNPFRRDYPVSLSDVQDEINRLLDRVVHGGLSTRPLDGQEWAPLVDIYESPDRFILRAELPGLDAADIDVSLVGEVLTLKGVKPAPPEDPATGRRIRGERRFGGFNRSIELPGPVDASQILAVCRRGVLEVTLPKSASSRPKSIQVKVED